MNNYGLPPVPTLPKVILDSGAVQAAQSGSWFNGLGNTVNDGVSTALGWYEQWTKLQTMKDSSGQSQLENSNTPYVKTNIQTQSMSAEQLAAQANAQKEAVEDSKQLINGVDNKMLYAGAGLLVLLLVLRGR